MAGFVLKVKTKSGQKLVNGLVPQDKVAVLKSKLADVTGISVEALHVLGGFPPKAIDLNNESATIADSGIVSGDTLIVEEKEVINGAQIATEIGRSHIVNDETFINTPGVLMKMVVPADNSCLFTSVGYVLNGILYSSDILWNIIIFLQTHSLFKSDIYFLYRKS